MIKATYGAAPWSKRPLAMSLSLNEIHIWRAEPDESINLLEQCRGLLSSDERKRAGRYHFDRDRNRFVLRRGILRTILGLYTNIVPDQLAFKYSECGKPELADGEGVKNIRFNLSFSNGLTLLAFARDQEIGIDVEHVRQVSETEEISLRFFTAFENYTFRSLPEARKKEAFFSLWTCKEAFIKATGHGMSCPLNKFCVSLVPGETSRLLSIEENPEEACRWSIIPFAPAAGYMAAMAVRSRAYQVKYWQWENGFLGSEASSNG